MAFTHVEIEERRTRTLVFLFAILLALYVSSLIVLVWGIRLFLGFSTRLALAQVLAIVAVAIGIAAVHWLMSAVHLLPRILTVLQANPIDPTDTYHAQFKNIVEEVSVATGGRYHIAPYVIATPAVNACAMSDLHRQAAIIVTEGLLARLNRAQLESVIGHEAAHIARGDSVAHAVLCGLFSLHEEALKRLSGAFGERSGYQVRGRGAALIAFVIIILWLTTKAKRVCELAISRQQEYRADAVAVRLTRNPLALAEALHVIENHWRGVGAVGESLSTIFIVDPGVEWLSEREGLAADWFSTHPPTHRRIEALLGMVHVKPDAFGQAMAARRGRPKRLLTVPESSDAAPFAEGGARWVVWTDGEWSAPMALDELMRFEALTPQSWIRREGEQATTPASHDPDVLAALKRRYQSSDAADTPSRTECPHCRIGLRRRLYEGVSVEACPACQGCYVTPNQLTRVFAREEYAFSDSIRRLARAIPSVRGTDRVVEAFGSPRHILKDRRCPACGGAVLRKFYTQAYLVEVEQCFACGLTWLDKDELELLQCLYEDTRQDKPDQPH